MGKSRIITLTILLSVVAVSCTPAPIRPKVANLICGRYTTTTDCFNADDLYNKADRSEVESLQSQIIQLQEKSQRTYDYLGVEEVTELDRECLEKLSEECSVLINDVCVHDLQKCEKTYLNDKP